MKAFVIKGKYKGQIFEVSQWSNDWFSLESVNIEIANKPFPPTMLAFTATGFKEIQEHKHNGMLFEWFESRKSPSFAGRYMISFKKRKI